MESELSSSLPSVQPRESVCTVCQTVLTQEDLFCPRCGPPEPPPEVLPEALSLGQASLRILMILVLFGVVVFFKMKPDLEKEVGKLITGLKPEFTQTEKGEKPKDEDFHVVHSVNVPFANVREKASTQSPVVTVLERGEEVKVLYKGDQWSQIEMKGKSGWIATRLLDSKIE